MKKEELLDALGGIGQEYIEAAGKAEEKKERRPWWLVPAAAVLMLGLALLPGWMNAPKTSGEPGAEQRLLDAVGQPESVLRELASSVTEVPVGHRSAWYELLYAGPAGELVVSAEYYDATVVLEPFVGECFIKTDTVVWGGETVRKAQTWYRVKDMQELKYLISRDEDGRLRLWKFDYFEVTKETDEEWIREIYRQVFGSSGDGKKAETMLGEVYRKIYGFSDCDDFSPYTYEEVYRLIYGVDSADDIVSVTAAAPHPITSELIPEYRIQEEVVSRTITDRAGLQRFYACTKDATFRTAHDWSGFEKTRGRFTYSFSLEETSDPFMASDPVSSAPAIRGGRWLTVTLKSGTTIDDWKYQALNGVMWQWGGIISDPIPEEDVYALNDLFGIR